MNPYNQDETRQIIDMHGWIHGQSIHAHLNLEWAMAVLIHEQRKTNVILNEILIMKQQEAQK